MRRLAAVAALAAAFCAPARAAEPSTRTFKLLYTGGWEIWYAEDLDGALERAIGEEPSRVALDGVGSEWTFYSKGNYLLGLPKGRDREALPVPGARTRDAGPVDIVESAISVVVVRPAGTGLAERVAAFASDPALKGIWLPSVELKRGVERIYPTPAGEVEGVAAGPQPGDHWARTFAVRYRLKVDGKPAEAVVITKPAGTPPRTLASVRRRRAEVREPLLALNLGRISLPADLGISAERLLEPFTAAGFRIHAANDFDLTTASAALRAAGAVVLCANIEGDPGVPVERVRIETVGGVRVGLFSLVSPDANPRLKSVDAQFHVADPYKAADAAIRELQAAGADLIVGISHLSVEMDAVLLRDTPGMDVLLGGRVGEAVSRRKTVVELSDWGKEHHSPAHISYRPGGTYGELTFTLKPDGGRLRLARIEETFGAPGLDLPEDPEAAQIVDHTLREYVTPAEPILPDPRRLWGGDQPKHLYREEEFWSLAAHAVRERTGAEAALLRIQGSGSNVQGGLPETYLREWLRPDGELRVLRLSGKALRDAAEFLSGLPLPVPKGTPHPDFFPDVVLAGAGVAADGTVNGLPIADDEYYAVAVTDEMMNLPELAQLRGAKVLSTGNETLAPMVLGWIKEAKARPDFDAGLRAAMTGRVPARPIWRLHLKEVSLDAANVKVQDGARLPDVSDDRVHAIDQTALRGTVEFVSELYLDRFRWDAGVSAEYGRTSLRPPAAPEIRTESADSLLFETDLQHRTWDLGPRGEVGPYVGLAYDTELRRDQGRPVRRLVDLETGLKLSDGRFLEEAWLGAIAERDNTTSAVNTEYGVSAGLSWSSRIGGSPNSMELEASYLQFARSEDDTPDDLLRRLEAELRLSVPLPGDLHLAPYARFFLFEGKVIHFTGYNLETGVSLRFSRLWKPSY